MLTRRLFIAGASASALAAPAILRARSLWRDYPFGLGVTSGDPTSDGFVIWTRVAPNPLEPHGGMPLAVLPVAWEVATDSGFGSIVARGEELARPELGHSVHVEVSGLQPDRVYYYRFTVEGERSLRGRARTLPLTATSPSALKFGVCGCQNFEDGFFGAYRHLAREDLAFVYHYGDFIYEYRQDYEYVGGLPVYPVRQHAYRDLMDVADYRIAYGQQLTDVDLQAARSSHVFLSSFDDHEIVNDWVSDVANWRMELGNAPDAPPSDIFMLRKAAAMQVWYEHMPVRRSMLPRGGMVPLNRELRYGNLMAMQLLDTRQFRSDQPCDDGFKPECAGVRNNAAQVLGREQEEWLNRNLSRSGGHWNTLAQQVMMMSLDRRRRADEPQKILNMDSWAGYEIPRQLMLNRMAGLSNVVVLTGDEHQNIVGNLIERDRVVGSEFVVTSISSGGDGSDVRSGNDVFMANNPEVKFTNDQRGYAVCEVTPDAWQTHYMVVDKVTTRENSVANRATATVANNERGVSVSLTQP